MKSADQEQIEREATRDGALLVPYRMAEAQILRWRGHAKHQVEKGATRTERTKRLAEVDAYDRVLAELHDADLTVRAQLARAATA